MTDPFKNILLGLKDIIENQSNIEEFNISEIEVLIENTDQIEKEIENIVSKILIYWKKP